MQIKILLLSFFIINASTLNAQLYETLEKNAADLIISLSDHNPDYKKDFETLKSNLFADINSEELKNTYLTSKTEFDSLKAHFSVFENELNKISFDSALVLVNNWYLHFQSIFYEYSKQNFFYSDKTKILFFSTSMSCHCTLKMSREQTVELLKYFTENVKKYHYWIVDSYWFNDLQIKFETLFAPSVIVLSGNNEILYKLEYEEKMLANLKDYLNNNGK